MTRTLPSPQVTDRDNVPIVLGVTFAFAGTGMGSVIPATHELWKVWVGEPVWTLVLFPAILALGAFLILTFLARGWFRNVTWQKVVAIHVIVAATLAATPWFPAILNSDLLGRTAAYRSICSVLATLSAVVVLLAIGSAITIHSQWQIQLRRSRPGFVAGIALSGMTLGCIFGGAALHRVGVRGEFLLAAILNLVLIAALFPWRSTFQSRSGSIANQTAFASQRHRSWATGIVIGLIVGGGCQLWTRLLPLVTSGRFTNVGLIVVSVLLGFGVAFSLAQLKRIKIRRRGVFLGAESLVLALLLPLTMLQAPSAWARAIGNNPDNRLVLLLILVSVVPGVVAGIAASATAARGKAELVLRWVGIGMAIGWMTFGWIGVPIIGMQSSLGILSAAALVLAMVTWLTSSYPARRTRVMLAAGGSAIFLLGIWGQGLLGGMRVLPEMWVASGLASIHETTMGVLTTTPTMDGNRLAVDLRPIANRVPQPQQSFSVQLACLRRGTAGRMLLINLANGADAAVTHQAEQVLVCDATREVADEFMRLAPPTDYSNRVRPIIADARNLLRTTAEEFDVIAVGADLVPSPESAGLETVEFFEAARARLTAGGLYCHEVSFWNYRVEEFRSLLGTFHSVFPESSSLWYAGRKLVLMGIAPVAPAWQLQDLKDRLTRQEIQQQLSFSFVGGSDNLLNRSEVIAGAYLCGSKAIQQLSQDSPQHTDDLVFLARTRGEDPILALAIYELLQPVLESIDEEMKGSEFSFTAAVQRIQTMNLRQVVAESLAATADRELQASNLTAALSHFSQACVIAPFFSEAHLARGDTLALGGALEQAIEAYQRAVEIAPTSSVAHTRLGYALLKAGYFAKASTSFEAALRVNPNDPRGIVGLAWMLSTSPQDDQRDSNRAFQLLARLQGSPYENQPEVLDALAAAFANSGDFERATYAAESARQVALSIGNRPLASDIQARVDLYRQQRPYRCSIPAG